MDDIDFIPLKNLPFSGLISHEYKKQREDGTAEPDNVLVAGLGRFSDVSIIGRTLEGGMWFASSLLEEDTILEHLKDFKSLLEKNRE